MAGYSQNDPKWAADFLGKSTYWRMGTVNGDTSRAAGCLMTAGSDVCKAFGHDITPGDLNRLATSRGLIDTNGDVTRWDWLSVLFSDIIYVESLYWGTQPADLSYFDIANDPNTEIILMIDDSPSAGMQTHYMRTAGLSGDDVIVDDSWDAIRKGVSAYGKRWAPAVSAQAIIYRAIKYKRGTSQVVSQPAAPQGEEMIENIQQAHDAYYLLRGDGAVSDDEINGCAGRRAWDDFAVSAKAEVSARTDYRKALESHVADLTTQVGRLTDQLTNLGARPTLEQLQAAQAQATELTTELQSKSQELSDLKKQVEQCAVPVAPPQTPLSPSSLLQSLVDAIKKLFN